MEDLLNSAVLGLCFGGIVYVLMAIKEWSVEINNKKR
jgi:hypothetical protein